MKSDGAVTGFEPGEMIVMAARRRPIDSKSKDLYSRKVIPYPGHVGDHRGGLKQDLRGAQAR